MTSFTFPSYPHTKKENVVDRYFGTDVTDPYRWLEDDMSDETGAWVKAQNQVTASFLDQIQCRADIKKRLQDLWNYEKVSAPFTHGEYTYFYKNDGLQDQDVIYRQQDEGAPTIFLDPNTFSKDGTVSLSVLSFSKDGSLAAYAVSEGGSDWRKVYIIDTQTMEQLDSPLIDIKFSGLAWRGCEGFYYSSYDKPLGSELSAKTDQHKLYFHRIGEPQSNDTLIFGGTPAEKYRYVSGSLTEDHRFLAISAAQSTSSNNLFLMDLNENEPKLIAITNDTQADTHLVDNQGDKLFLVTNLDAPNQKIVIADAHRLQVEYWQDLIDETQHVLSINKGGGYLFAHYMVDAISRVIQYSYKGEKIRDIELPGLGTITGLAGRSQDTTLYYSFTNYTTPGTVYALNPSDGKSEVHRPSGARFDSSQYTSTQVFYESADGTQVPMIISHKIGLELDGKNPTILYGYGGFNISLTPEFSVVNAVWLEMGGVYAVPNLRGGGEYGKQWHKAGTQMQKQNVFDDFIAAAEYLIEANYTSTPFLAIRGGSNGGLLVGATMTQRPDLMQVALPAVGVLDMLRYHTFTAGAGWAYDYGTADQSEEMFEYLQRYSPVHNVRAQTHYPATLVTTGDHDDRVVPAHSFKFAATLQEHQTGQAPTLIRIETDAGHGLGTPLSKLVEQYADIFAFTLFNMGIVDVFSE